MRAVYEETDAELEEFLQGVTEEEAGYHPEPDAWSVKETLAHLIVGERWYTNWITTLISDSEPWYDRYGGNVPQRNRALLAAYPTVPELLDELKRTEVETVALLAALPPEFVARKGSYLRLGYSLLELPGYHTRDHLNQVRPALEHKGLPVLCTGSPFSISTISTHLGRTVRTVLCPASRSASSTFASIRPVPRSGHRRIPSLVRSRLRASLLRTGCQPCPGSG